MEKELEQYVLSLLADYPETSKKIERHFSAGNDRSHVIFKERSDCSFGIST